MHIINTKGDACDAAQCHMSKVLSYCLLLTNLLMLDSM